MKIFMALLRLHVGRQLRRPSFWIAFSFPLILIFSLGIFSPKEQEGTLVIGILIEADTLYTQAFFEKLTEMETPPVSFIRADHREQLDEMVASSAWECGYILCRKILRLVWNAATISSCLPGWFLHLQKCKHFLMPRYLRRSYLL